MQESKTQKEWNEYKKRELASVLPILEEMRISVGEEQPHIGGERYLMSGARDVGGGGRKLILLGTHKDAGNVVIKTSSDPDGKREIELQHKTRETLDQLKFAYNAFASPDEVAYTEQNGHLILVTRHIQQESSFLERDLREQFALALKALKLQEGAHATAASHIRVINRLFSSAHVEDYLKNFETFYSQAVKYNPGDSKMAAALDRARIFLAENRGIVEQYSGFLTHADFVPHNLRIKKDVIYLLDHPSLYFGNKYESWARFCNFMMLHNPPLEHALVQYVRDNRTEEESLSLRLMRVYKLAFLLSFYAETLTKTSGDLNKLSRARVDFWTNALESILENLPLSENIIEVYKNQRDSLRSEDEKRRQKNLH